MPRLGGATVRAQPETALLSNLSTRSLSFGWLVSATFNLAVGLGTWLGMKRLYFDDPTSQDECGDNFDRLSGSAIETVIGAFPMWVRTLLLTEAFFWFAKKLSVRRRSVLGLTAAVVLAAGLASWEYRGTHDAAKVVLAIGGSVIFTFCAYGAREVCFRVTGFGQHDAGLATALLLGPASLRASHGTAASAGWLAIVGGRSVGTPTGEPAKRSLRDSVRDGLRGFSSLEDTEGSAPQVSWHTARQARGLNQRQAAASAVTKLLMWHWSQPITYLWMLHVYRCYVASLGIIQVYLASVVAAREMIYLGSTLLALKFCPVFLLLDPVTVWNEADNGIQRCMRVAAYVLTPHNYTAMCLANRFRGWRRAFLGLAGAQVLADLSSCFALGALLAGSIQHQQGARDSNTTPTALIIGYVITASGFVLFFGPLSVASSLSGAADTSRHRCARAGLALGGGGLLCALAYVVMLYVLLIGGWFNPYCDGFTLDSDPCNGHGQCYGAGQCSCDPGFGPDGSYGEEAVCGRHVVCTAEHLRRAVAEHAEEACGGPHFAGSQLLTPEWSEALATWSARSVGAHGWTRCCSTFEGCDTAAKFHDACDPHNITLTVAHNSNRNHTFGGFVRPLTSLFFPRGSGADRGLLMLCCRRRGAGP